MGLDQSASFVSFLESREPLLQAALHTHLGSPQAADAIQVSPLVLLGPLPPSQSFLLALFQVDMGNKPEGYEKCSIGQVRLKPNNWSKLKP